MIAGIIRWSIRNRFLVLLLTVMAAWLQGPPRGWELAWPKVLSDQLRVARKQVIHSASLSA